jgi:branched-chain amino acid transport system ATP-binding protein
MSSLAITELVVRRGRKTVVDGLSLALASGGITALLGPNGAGKSSLVLALAGVLPIERGQFTCDGKELAGQPPESIRAAGVAAVPEGHRVLSLLTVEENLRSAGFQLSATDVKASADEVYGIFPELAERKGQKAGSLSGGQQQMLALGQALVSRPKFILVDEMSLGLAPIVVKRLMGVLDTLAERGVGILLIEQFTHLALKHASHAHIMSRGRIRFAGETAEIVRRPEILHDAYLAG